MILCKELTIDEVKYIAEATMGFCSDLELDFYVKLMEAMRIPMFANHQSKDGS